jgi:hypothetical protein
LLPEAGGLTDTLSPSALSNYEICGRRGQFYQDPEVVRVGTNLGLARGGALHKALEVFGEARLYYGDSMVGGLDYSEIYDAAVAIAFGHFGAEMLRDDMLVGDDDPDEYLNSLATMLQTWVSEPSHMWFDTHVSIRAVEQEVFVDFGSPNHLFHGFIDAVYDVASHGVVGVDYKTANRRWGGAKRDGDPRLLIQAPLYAEAWTRTTGEEMNAFAYDVYLPDGRFDRVWVDTNADVRAVFVERWNEVSDMVATFRKAGLDLPTNPSHFLCSEKWCEFWEMCPMGAELDRMTRERK